MGYVRELLSSTIFEAFVRTLTQVLLNINLCLVGSGYQLLQPLFASEIFSNHSRRERQELRTDYRWDRVFLALQTGIDFADLDEGFQTNLWTLKSASTQRGQVSRNTSLTYLLNVMQ